MNPSFTVLVSVGAILATALMGRAAAVNDDDFRTLVFWTGAPYLGHCLLAFGRREHGAIMLAWTLIAGGLATLAYWANFRPMIVARQEGWMVLNCAGPLVEAAVPLIQWALVVVLILILPGRPISDARSKLAKCDPEL